MSSEFALKFVKLVNMEFKDIFADLRKEKGISQEKLAKEMGVSFAAINHWENGKREPTLNMLRKISKYFDVTIDYLAGFEQ